VTLIEIEIIKIVQSFWGTN